MVTQGTHKRTHTRKRIQTNGRCSRIPQWRRCNLGNTYRVSRPPRIGMVCRFNERTNFTAPLLLMLKTQKKRPFNFSTENIHSLYVCWQSDVLSITFPFLLSLFLSLDLSLRSVCVFICVCFLIGGCVYMGSGKVQLECRLKAREPHCFHASVREARKPYNKVA